MTRDSYWRALFTVTAVLIILFLTACASQQSVVDETGELTAADFGVPAEATEHDHDDHDHDDHDHDNGPADAEHEEDHAATETGEDGVIIDHHGNRIVDELYQKFEQDGLTLEFTAENFLGVGGRGGEISADIQAGERALIKFKVSETASGEPVTGLRPAAWLDLQTDEHTEGDPEEQSRICRDNVEGYLSGMLTARPTVDLNSFFILALNNDASISVIDPTVDVAGMTQLFALIQLTQPGEDWAISADQEELWVTVPGMNQVAVAELDGFTLAHHLEGGSNPQRIAFQPDQGYLWIGNDAENARESGVTVIDPQTRQIVAQIATGAGHHELAFSPDSRYAYVTSSEDGRLSVIDAEKLEVLDEITVGREPAAVAVAASSGTIYVGDRRSGGILVLDGESLKELAELQTEPGLAALGLTPDGRWGIATNPEAGQVIIFDTSSNTVTHVAQIDGAPDQISFSQETAYIRAREAAQIIAIPLAEIDPAAALPLNMVPVGQQAPGFFPSMALANAVLPIPEQQAVVIANPADDQVYFYPEGATAVSGSFQGHTLFPRAVQVVDRSIREVAPGVYTGRVRIPEDGQYLVAVMLGDPLLVHCFEFTAKPNEEAEKAAGLPEIVFLNDSVKPVAGEPFILQFLLANPENGEGIEGLADVFVLGNQVAGNWSTRTLATSVGDGVYEAQLTMPKAGLYSVFFAVPSIGLNIGHLPGQNLEVVDGG